MNLFKFIFGDGKVTCMHCHERKSREEMYIIGTGDAYAPTPDICNDCWKRDFENDNSERVEL